jgi:gamma-glutamylaminecyclotransferase
MMPRVFVYGTLKRGFPLHNEGLAGAIFLGAYRTVEPYPMLIAGPRYAPMMLDQPGRGLQVSGELYEVSRDRLEKLDALESVGVPGNERGRLLIERLDGGASLEVDAFFKGEELARPAHSRWLTTYALDARFIPPK